MNSGRFNRFVIKTPEGIIFSMQLAGPVTRCFAWLIDMITLTLAAGVLGALIMTVGQAAGAFLPVLAEWTTAAAMVGFFAANFAYFIGFEWLWRGQTLGKWFMRLRVIDEQGLKLQFSQVAIRNLLRPVDQIPALYLVGGVASLLSERAQRLGDFAANTIVVYAPDRAEPDLEDVLAGKYNSLRGFPHLEARLRKRVSADEARIALQALLRRDTLEPSERIRLFADIAGHFRGLVPFPEEATTGVADEQYVRNVVDILFRPQSLVGAPENAAAPVGRSTHGAA
jgi:uncharacterized RDD family membrane protein YckC